MDHASATKLSSILLASITGSPYLWVVAGLPVYDGREDSYSMTVATSVWEQPCQTCLPFLMTFWEINISPFLPWLYKTHLLLISKTLRVLNFHVFALPVWTYRPSSWTTSALRFLLLRKPYILFCLSHLKVFFYLSQFGSYSPYIPSPWPSAP